MASRRMVHCLRSVTAAGVCHKAPLCSRRWIAIYAADPARWQSDPCIQMYGQMLCMRDQQTEAFVIAVDTMRSQRSVPSDLRASAGRSKAAVLFKSAAKSASELQLALDAPWPKPAFERAVSACQRACVAGEEAYVESSAPTLWAAVLPYCPEWPQAVSSARATYIESKKLLADLHLRHVRWVLRQANQARKATEEEGAADPETLEAVGLLGTVEVSEVLKLAVDAADLLVAAAAPVVCNDDDFASGSRPTQEEEAALRALRSKGQSLRIVASGDFAVALAKAGQLQVAGEQILRALQMRVEDVNALSIESFEQVREAANGILALCTHEAMNAETQAAASSAANLGRKVAEAISSFTSWKVG
mmetsp:Transcript_3121/g.7920  ORF Transcript_3121/g.7920 Transcript_3121/m.7920 type:complete len:362 (-) Transcript_3121:12-1097(-)